MHGSLAHARDFDDTFPDSVMHPGSTVIAASLAAGERATPASRALTSAIVVGYEVAARLGAVAGRGFHARGFHATGVVGPIAAAAAAGRMLRLDAAAMADAHGARDQHEQRAAGLPRRRRLVEMAAHRLVGAMAALIAAELAGHGFRGPRHALDHRYGLYGAFLGEPDADLDALTDGLGERLARRHRAAQASTPALMSSSPISTQLSRCARDGTAHRRNEHIARSLRAGAMGDADRRRAARHQDRSAQRSRGDRQPAVHGARPRSATAVSILRRLQPETIGRADIARLAAHITCSADDRSGTGFDGRMEVALRDGDSMSPIRCGHGAERGARIIAKFRANTAAPAARRIACTRIRHAAREAARASARTSCRRLP